MIFKSAAFSDLSDTVIVSRAITPLIYDASFLMPESSPANTIRIFLSAAIGLEPNTGAVDISFFLFFFIFPCYQILMRVEIPEIKVAFFSATLPETS